jgi:ribosomal protein S27E
MDSDTLNIYCPCCKRKVAVYNTKATIAIDVKCKRCNKLVIYIPKTKETLVRPLPERVTSSGLRFY